MNYVLLAHLAATLFMGSIIWFVQVPRHSALGSDFDREAHKGLVLSNWVRTVAWSLRGALVLWMVARISA